MVKNMEVARSVATLGSEAEELLASVGAADRAGARFARIRRSGAGK